MEYIVITDIFGNKIKNNDETDFPFILVHTNQPYLLLQKIAGTDEDGIWRIIFTTMMHLLYSHSINPSNYAPLGDYWFPSKNLQKQTQILLVSTRQAVSKYPKDYVPIDTYKGATVWRPISEMGYRPIGLVLSVEKPPNNLIRTINSDLVIKSTQKRIVVENLTNTPDTHLLMHKSIEKLAIDKTKFMIREKQFRFISKKNHKQLGTDDTRFTTQGQLIQDDKCYGIYKRDGSNNNNVDLQPCDDSITQKWHPYRSSLVSQYDGTCLVENNGTLTTTDCTGTDDQGWIAESKQTVIDDTNQEITDQWKSSTGKRVVLLEPDYPWYINKTGRIPEGIVVPKRTELNQVAYRDNADYKTNFMMDTTKIDLGYGHSYAARLGAPCAALSDCDNIEPKDQFILENFDGEIKQQPYQFNLIASVLLSCVIVLVTVRVCINNKLV
jgi:hypothetical protein